MSSTYYFFCLNCHFTLSTTYCIVNLDWPGWQCLLATRLTGPSRMPRTDCQVCLLPTKNMCQPMCIYTHKNLLHIISVTANLRDWACLAVNNKLCLPVKYVGSAKKGSRLVSRWPHHILVTGNDGNELGIESRETHE